MLGRTAPALIVMAALFAFAAPAAAGGFEPGRCLNEAEPIGEVSILVMDACFRPDAIQIEAGQVVRWEVVPGSTPHTVTFNKAIDSGELGELGQFAVKFRTPGSYAYVCAFHPGMAGSVEVSGAAMPGVPLEVVPASRFVSTQAAPDEAELASASTHQLLIKIDHVTALLLVLFGLSVGAGSVAAARMMRGG